MLENSHPYPTKFRELDLFDQVLGAAAFVKLMDDLTKARATAGQSVAPMEVFSEAYDLLDPYIQFIVTGTAARPEPPTPNDSTGYSWPEDEWTEGPEFAGEDEL